jgi:uncharacterized protein (TIGR02246 family)
VLKRTVTGGLLALLTAGVAAQSESSARDEVIAAQKRFYDAYRTCNKTEMASLVTDDMMYLHSTGGLQKNKAELVNSLNPEKCNFEVLRVDPTSVRVYGDAAIVFGNLHYKPKNGPETRGGQLAVQVFVRRNGRWLFAHNQSMEPIPLDTNVRLAAEKK